jgi:hypothetical protein
VAEVIAINVKLALDRESKRKKPALIKWFDENFELIGPFLDRLILLDMDGQAITGHMSSS